MYNFLKYIQNFKASIRLYKNLFIKAIKFKMKCLYTLKLTKLTRKLHN